MKILVLSHNAFSKTHNNGKTLSSMFASFRKDELCQLFFSPVGEPDFDRCDNYYLIRDIDALKSIFIRWRCGSEDVKTMDEIPSKLRRDSYHWIVLLLRSVVWKLSSWNSSGLNKWLKEQNPDLIFFVGGIALFSHEIAWKLSKKLNVPLVTFFTDDYIIYPKQNIYIGLAKQYYMKTVQKSKLVYAIGTQMAGEYSQFFSRKFMPIMNISTIPSSEPPYQINKSSIRINYFGGIGWARDVELLRFAIFFEDKIAPNLTKEVKIGIYTFGEIAEDVKVKLLKCKVAIHNGLIGDELKKEMTNTDIFLHVESIEPKYCSLTKLSVSTKIPEYMSFAKPIIAFGCAELASFGVISQVSKSLVLNDTIDGVLDEEKINRFIHTINDKDSLSEIAHKNFVFAKNNFNIDVVSNRFRNELEYVLIK